MNNDLNQHSRSGYRAKRRKTNLILNSLIIIVLALIIFVAYNIFASGDSDNTSQPKQKPKTEQVKNEKKTDDTALNQESAKTEEAAKEDTGDENETTQNDQQQNNEQAEEASTEGTDSSQAVVSDGGSSANVIRTIENPAWKPVGTSQTGQHTPVYNSNSVDWQEMLNAITYATGLDQNNMIVWFLGRDRSTTNASIGTVSSKDKQQKYRVYIKWVDGEGWVPTKVEELAKIDR
ncbi:YrrS family protein [Neobacillus sp. OS1-32]|jgi:hypothetical protein|uniref:YrrS family protein n=1 Tax=Neobacillus paridis TaxID=2803862 RepID=A0ABS1TJ11_9BACI|nr:MULTISPECIES: YrrS family protein [Neobacillus]MBL4951306.1 YrrS family protein [Neobacillus paridis]WML30622.1 YrrS family protein [Neobacillus sp. OS1-32]